MEEGDARSAHIAMSDDACGGLRGRRAECSDDLAALLHAAYGFEREAISSDLGGSSCLNLLAIDGDDEYIVRVYRPYVTPRRIEDMRRVKTALSDAGVPCAAVKRTRQGRDWCALGERLVEVERYVAHTGVMDTTERIERALPVMGRMLSVLDGIRDLSDDAQNPLFANYLPAARALEATRRGCARIRSWQPTAYERALASDALRLAERVARAEAQAAADRPDQLVHGDFWHNNVLFAGDDIVLVADFDFMGMRRRIDDIALTLYFANAFLSNDSCERDVRDAGTIDRVRLLRSYVDLVDGALDEPLSDAERMALPLALAQQPLWSIGGWVRILDREQAARDHAADMLWYVRWGNDVVDNLREWQRIFTA